MMQEFLNWAGTLIGVLGIVAMLGVRACDHRDEAVRADARQQEQIDQLRRDVDGVVAREQYLHGTFSVPKERP